MAANQALACSASNRDVCGDPPTSKQDCSDVVHLSVYFDGTGNNKDADAELKRWSNVARLWLAADFASRADTNANSYAIYISGVGTPFNGKPLSAAEANDIKVEDGAFLGSGTGRGGTRRLDLGGQQVNDALRQALLRNAKALGGKVAQYAEAGKAQSFGDVSKALAQHRLIRQINVSIIGFSRGAALARAFCNQWLWDCSEDHGKLSYHGIPIRFGFLGLFDTVASFGLPSANVSNWLIGGGFKGRDLVVDPRVERCVHFVAAHELRFSFPVDLIRRHGQVQGGWLEKVYPGVHSDVGGGYQPLAGAGGKAQANHDNQGIDNNYARIPMRDMMTEADVCGVRLISYGQLANSPNYKALFSERFECKPETEKAFQAYRAVCNPAGTVEQQVQRHMEQFYSAYGTLHRRGRQSLTQREHQAGQSWTLGPADVATEIDNFHRAQADIRRAASSPFADDLSGYIAAKSVYAMWIEPAQWQLSAWGTNAPAGVANFIGQWVHDSKVGFLSNAEPFSYFSKRGISESSHSVQGWFEDHVVGPFGRAYDATADAAKRAANYTEQKASEAYDTTRDAAQRAADYTEQKASEAYDATKDAAQRAANYTEQKASEAYDATADAVSQAASKGKQVLDSAGTAIGNAGTAAGNATGQAIDAVKGAWSSLFGH